MQKTQVRTGASGGSFHSVISRRRSTRQYLEKIISKSRVGNNIRFFGLGTSGGGGGDLLLPTCRVLWTPKDPKCDCGALHQTSPHQHLILEFQPVLLFGAKLRTNIVGIEVLNGF